MVQEYTAEGSSNSHSNTVLLKHIIEQINMKYVEHSIKFIKLVVAVTFQEWRQNLLILIFVIFNDFQWAMKP